MKNRYLIISPCRNEAKYMRKTIESILSQSLQPIYWLIVNDGSTDETSSIINEYTKKYDFIHTIDRKNRGYRNVGPGVIESFYEGYKKIENLSYDFLCKLDLDLELPSNYFQILIQRMHQNDRIGTCSGKPYFINQKGALVSEKCGDENSVGMTKLYRKECFEEIGGFVKQVMWDGIDGHRCRMKGWIACSWDEPELRFIHLRPMGSSQKNIITGRLRHGFGQYFMGTDIIYMAATSLYRMTRPPFIIGGLAMFSGYLTSLLLKKDRYDDLAFRSFLRKYQRSCLINGKEKATLLLNNQSEDIFYTKHSN